MPKLHSPLELFFLNKNSLYGWYSKTFYFLLQNAKQHTGHLDRPTPTTRWTQANEVRLWGGGAAEGDCGWGPEPGITPINLTPQ